MGKHATLDEFIAAGEQSIEELDKKAAEEAVKPAPEAPELDALAPEPEKKTPVMEKEVPKEDKPVEKPKPEKDWKAEHDKMYGKLSGEIGELKKAVSEVPNLTQRIETLLKENAELKAGKTEVPKTAVDGDTLESLVKSFGEDDAKAIAKLIRTEAEAIADRKLKDALDHMGKEVGAVRTDIAKSAQQIYDDALLRVLPDAYEIGNSTEFADWLADNDWTEVFSNAHRSHNVTKVLEKLNKYKATLKNDTDPDAEKAEADRKAALDEMGQPPKGHGTKEPASAKKTYTKAEFDGFMNEYAKGALGKYGENNPKADALYQDMVAANDEGRIISP